MAFTDNFYNIDADAFDDFDRCLFLIQVTGQNELPE